MRIDLHVHTSDRSDCGRSPEAEMIAAAKAAGLDAIAFTDHGRLPPPGHLSELNRAHAPFRIFPGIEVAISGEDFVVIGLEDPRLEREDWTYRELRRFVARKGGFIFLAHPFRFSEEVASDVRRFVPDGVEVNSINMAGVDRARLAELVEGLAVRRLCNSDSHGSELVGVYHNVLDESAADPAGLVAMLKAGRFTCARMDERIAAANASGRFRFVLR